LYVQAEVREHLAFVGQQAGIAALPWSEGKDVVADDALQPLRTILARDTDLATMREIGYPYRLTDGTMFGRNIAIVGRHFPVGDFLKRRSELGMLPMKPGSFH
jgi:hypothetical protein